MGIPVVLDSALEDLSKRIGFSGTIGTLGVMDIDGGRNAQAYFSALGYNLVESIDVSDYEGADHIFDLNEPVLPKELQQRYEAVFNGGTLEHVFNVPNALASITNMLKPNGLIFHIVPCNGWVNHGFYQFSPVFMFDYYEAAGFEAIYSALVSYEVGKPGEWAARPMRQNDLAEGRAGAIFDGRVYLYMFVARRLAGAIDRPVPVQGMYSDRHFRQTTLPWFIPYEVKNGVRVDAAIEACETLSRFEHETGLCWVCSIPDLLDMADNASMETTSPLILLEDGQALGPAHAVHDDIRSIGNGRFSHWGASLYFSTSDNSDPTNNGRVYEFLILK